MHLGDTGARSVLARAAGSTTTRCTPAVCTRTGLPVAWQTHNAKDADVPVAPSLLDYMGDKGFAPATCSMDKGYDAGTIYDGCEARGIRPIVPLRETSRVLDSHGERCCPVPGVNRRRA